VSPAPEITAGTRFDHYEVLSRIGRGGMGEVWKARDTKLARFVAIKFIPPAWAADSQAVERLRIEARATSSLNHPNICTIYDFREYEGHPLIVMELMTGRTLRDRLDAGPMKTSETVDIGIQVTDALVAAHRRGIIHRDIKPENIFLTEDGVVKVLDFGLAKRFPLAMGVETTTTADTHNLTAVGGTAGTISYMSPEQASGEELDGRTDLFSLGVVLYNCATGHPPFTGKTVGLVLSSILNRAPVAPISLNPEIPPRFQEVIFNCLEKDREFRYQSAEELRAELKRVKRDLDLVHARSERLVADDVIEAGRTQPTRPAPDARPDAHGAENSWVAWTTRLGMALVALAVVAVAITLWQRPGEPGDEVLSPDAPADQPFAPERNLQRARDNLASGDFPAAVQSSRDALAEAPENAEATRILEEAQAQVDRFDAAVVEARRRLDTGDAEGAQASLEMARAIDPTSPIVAELSTGLVDLLREINQAVTAQVPAARSAAESTETAPAGIAGTAGPEPPGEIAAGPDPLETAPAQPEPPAAAPDPEPPPETIPTTTAVTTESPPEVFPEAERALAVDAANSEAAEPQTPESVTASPPEAAAPEAAADVAAAPSPDGEADDTEIRRVIGLYERALETKDLDLLRQVKPNLSAAEIASFNRGEAAQVEINILEIVREDDRASVRVERRDDLPQSSRFEQTLRLLRTGGGWVIDVFSQ
jgi:Protein kinase domain